MDYVSECSKCGRMVTAQRRLNGYYGHRCCGMVWVVVGSPVDVANELIDAAYTEINDSDNFSFIRIA